MQWWQRRRDVFLEDFIALYANKSLDESLKSFGSLQGCAQVYTRQAFHLLMVDQYEEAHQAIDHAHSAAEQALRIKSFEQLFRGAVRHQQEYLLVEEAVGRMQTLKSLHYIDWFRTGERPLEILSEALTNLHVARNFNPPWYDLKDVMMDYVQAGQYLDATELYSSDRSRKNNEDFSPKNGVESTLFLLAEGLSQRTQNTEAARQAVSYWYGRSLNWTVNDVNLPWWMRLGWAYLWHHHFSKPLELQPLLRELRGF